MERLRVLSTIPATAGLVAGMVLIAESVSSNDITSEWLGGAFVGLLIGVPALALVCSRATLRPYVLCGALQIGIAGGGGALVVGAAG